MSTLPLGAAWRALPAGLAVGLLRDSGSREQRLHCSLHLLEAASAPAPSSGGASSSKGTARHNLQCACDLLAAAWEAVPEDRRTIAQLLQLHRAVPFLSTTQAGQLTALRACPVLPETSEPEAWPEAIRFLGHWLAGLRHWDDGAYAEALDRFRAVDGGWLTPLELTGHCLCRLGRREEAFALWRDVLAARPWHANLIQCLHDRLRGFDTPPSAAELPPECSPVGSTAVLICSRNNADLLDATLNSLSASLPDVALIACLDNGSADATGTVLDAWKDRLGPKLFLPVSLPVDVGMPAARNWLMQLPEVRRLPFVAYLADDILVSPDWLRHLARAVQVRPDASTWGCRVVDARRPRRIQSGPLHLQLNFAPSPFETTSPNTALYAGEVRKMEGESPEVAFSLLRAHGEPFTAVDPAAGTDRGQWDLLRPCASVSGCCHLFRTSELTTRGGFALGLSPSQYADLEYDLRALDKGALACCTGFRAVRRAKEAESSPHLGGSAYGDGLGNRYKLQGMYDAARMTKMFRLEAAALEADLAARLEVLDGLC